MKLSQGEDVNVDQILSQPAGLGGLPGGAGMAGLGSKLQRVKQEHTLWKNEESALRQKLASFAAHDP